MEPIHLLLHLGFGQELLVELVDEVIPGKGMCSLEAGLLQPSSVGRVGQEMFGQLESIPAI